MKKRGIYLVANQKSQEMCENLIYSIRESGCTLPIRLIHFGGKEISSSYIRGEVEFLYYEDFPNAAKQLILSIQTIIPNHPPGYFYRYLAWFSDWNEFLYSDNDIVALCNWNDLFTYLDKYDFVHADKEYTTYGKYDYHKPEMLKAIFGENALESALTSGHIVVKRNGQMIDDIYKAIEWFKQHLAIPKKNDQSLMHIACLTGNWKKLNLCQAPYHWLSSWAGDYKNTLQIIQKTQSKCTKISHLHYSGGSPRGNLAIEDLLFSMRGDRRRLVKLSFLGLQFMSGYESIRRNFYRIKRFYNKKIGRNHPKPV